MNFQILYQAEVTQIGFTPNYIFFGFHSERSSLLSCYSTPILYKGEVALEQSHPDYIDEFCALIGKTISSINKSDAELRLQFSDFKEIIIPIYKDRTNAIFSNDTFPEDLTDSSNQYIL